jgi:hypothetical protein
MAIPFSPNNTVQTVGQFTAVFAHSSLWANNGSVNLKGFKLEDVFIHTDQLLDNSKMIPLVDGGVAVITNAMVAGRLTINTLRTSSCTNPISSSNTFNDPLGGDLVIIANYLQMLGDSIGGTLTLKYYVNNALITVAFQNVTVARCPPLILAGNDLPVYPVVLNYTYFLRT